MSYRPSDQPAGFSEESRAQQPEVFSLVDRHSSVEGTFASRRDLRIEGHMTGTLRCEGLLYIAEGANIDATVEAASITVAGQLRGTITCGGKLQIMPTGRVFATVTTESLVINDGAVYEGELRMDIGAGSPGLSSSTTEFGPEPDVPSVLRRFDTEGETHEALPPRQREE